MSRMATLIKFLKYHQTSLTSYHSKPIIIHLYNSTPSNLITTTCPPSKLTISAPKSPHSVSDTSSNSSPTNPSTTSTTTKSKATSCHSIPLLCSATHLSTPLKKFHNSSPSTSCSPMDRRFMSPFLPIIPLLSIVNKLLLRFIDSL
jgi:hypothetical protein